jgi:hypothetical protein
MDHHRETLRQAQATVAKIRGLRVQMQADAAKLADAKFSAAYAAEGKANLRTAAKQQADMDARNIRPRMAAALADRQNWTREGIIRRVKRFTPATTGGTETTDRQQVALLSDVRELLMAAHWRAEASQLSVTELVETFIAGLAQHHFAICNVLLCEADRRAADSRRTIATGTDESIAAGMDVRALPRQLRAALDASDLPELVGVDGVFTEMQATLDYLDSAVSALDTGEDPGARNQRVNELRRSGATNDQIREALAAA